jgi:hypothetical protein
MLIYLRRVVRVEDSVPEVRGMVYALWDTETNNLVAEYGSKREALAVVMQAIERNGVDDADSLTLESEDELGRVTIIAHGPALATMAMGEFAPKRHAG